MCESIYCVGTPWDASLILPHICHTEEFIVKGLSKAHSLHLFLLFRHSMDVKVLNRSALVAPFVPIHANQTLIYRITHTQSFSILIIFQSVLWFGRFLFTIHLFVFLLFGFCYLKNCYDFIINITMTMFTLLFRSVTTNMHSDNFSFIKSIFFLCVNSMCEQFRVIAIESIERRSVNILVMVSLLHAKYHTIRSISWRLFRVALLIEFRLIRNWNIVLDDSIASSRQYSIALLYWVIQYYLNWNWTVAVGWLVEL